MPGHSPSGQLFAAVPKRLSGLGRQSHELGALVRLERGQHLAEEALPSPPHGFDEDDAGGRQIDHDRPPVTLGAPPFRQTPRLEAVDQARRRRLVYANAIGELADPNAALLADHVERA